MKWIILRATCKNKSTQKLPLPLKITKLVKQRRLNKIFTYTAIIFTREGRKKEGIKVIKLTNHLAGCGLRAARVDDRRCTEVWRTRMAKGQGGMDGGNHRATSEGHCYNLWAIGGQTTRWRLTIDERLNNKVTRARRLAGRETIARSRGGISQLGNWGYWEPGLRSLGESGKAEGGQPGSVLVTLGFDFWKWNKKFKKWLIQK